MNHEGKLVFEGTLPVIVVDRHPQGAGLGQVILSDGKLSIHFGSDFPTLDPSDTLTINCYGPALERTSPPATDDA